MRRFYINRNFSSPGLFDAGRIIEGVQFSDGRVVVRWLTERSSLVIWDSLEDLLAVNCRGDASLVEWVDED